MRVSGDSLKQEIHKEISRAVSELPFRVGAIWLDCNIDYGEICFSYGEQFSFEIEEWGDAGYDYQSKGWNEKYWETLQYDCNKVDRSTLEAEFMQRACEALGAIQVQTLGGNISNPIVVMCVEHDDSLRGAIRRYRGVESLEGVEFAQVE